MEELFYRSSVGRKGEKDFPEFHGTMMEQGSHHVCRKVLRVIVRICPTDGTGLPDQAVLESILGKLSIGLQSHLFQ